MVIRITPKVVVVDLRVMMFQGRTYDSFFFLSWSTRLLVSYDCCALFSTDDTLIPTTSSITYFYPPIFKKYTQLTSSLGCTKHSPIHL